MLQPPPLLNVTIIRCDLTPADYRAWRRFVMFRIRKVHWIYGGIFAFFLVLTWHGAKPEETIQNKIFALIGFILVCSVLILLFTGISKLILRFTARFRDVLGPHTFEISNEAVIETNAHGRTETRINGIRRVCETKTHYFIINANNTGTIIPKRCVQDADALHTLQRLLASR